MWRTGAARRRGWRGRNDLSLREYREVQAPLAEKKRASRAQRREYANPQPSPSFEVLIPVEASTCEIGKEEESEKLDLGKLVLEEEDMEILEIGVDKDLERVLDLELDELNKEKGRNESFDSRKAVKNLDLVADCVLTPEKRELARLRERQLFEMERIRRSFINPADFVSPRKGYLPPRPISPPRPPNREEILEQHGWHLVDRRGPAEMDVITKGIMFGGLDPITTDPALDPPFGHCFNCWKGGHRSRRCPEEPRRHCKNCGRKGVILSECPRCSRVHRLEMERRYGKDNYAFHRDQREKYYKRTHDENPVPNPFGPVPPRSAANLLEALRELDQRLEGMSPEVVKEAKDNFLKDWNRQCKE